jgi:hypothetical protein
VAVQFAQIGMTLVLSTYRGIARCRCRLGPKNIQFPGCGAFNVAILLATLAIAACAAGESPSKGWTEYVKTKGQPEPVPADWVVTPEGKFAHSIELPQALPGYSGYRAGMTHEQYFDHLCSSEAGAFVYKTVAGIDGFYFMRPPREPTDDDLQDLYKLEAPDIERLFQLYRATPGDRSTIFIVPGLRDYKFVEERNPATGLFERASGVVPRETRPRELERSRERRSRYALTWRGIKRYRDRESGIAGSEWIVIDLVSNEVLGVRRNYVRTGGARNTASGVWWLNAVQCPNVKPAASAAAVAQQVYDFLAGVLIPTRRLSP